MISLKLSNCKNIVLQFAFFSNIMPNYTQNRFAVARGPKIDSYVDFWESFFYFFLNPLFLAFKCSNCPSTNRISWTGEIDIDFPIKVSSKSTKESVSTSSNV
jgi:hypothetical protein